MTLRDTLRAREPLVGSWLTIGHPVVAELAAREMEFVVVDREHSETDHETAANCVRAVEATETDCEALVRVPDADPAAIKRTLDLGPAGVVVPMIDDADDARDVVEACRYPTEGIRGVAGSRATDYGDQLGDHVENGSGLVTVVQAESGAAVEHAGEIAAVDGVDAILIGPADLSASLGCFGEWESAEFLRAVDRIVSAAHAEDVPVGTLATTVGQVSDRLDWGIDYLAAGTDAGYVADGAARYREAFETSE